MLSIQTQDEMAPVLVTKLCSTFLIPCTSGLGEGSRHSPSLLMSSISFPHSTARPSQPLRRWRATIFTASTRGFASLPSPSWLRSR